MAFVPAIGQVIKAAVDSDNPLLPQRDHREDIRLLQDLGHHIHIPRSAMCRRSDSVNPPASISE
jgi:hypothetical protein